MKKFVLPLIFVLAGMSFVTYSFLDTFIIPKNVRNVDIDNNTGFSFVELPISTTSSSSNKDSSSSAQHSSESSNSSTSESSSNFSFPSSENISTNEYYENLRKQMEG